MSLAIVLCGLIFLVGLAVLIGCIDAHARDAAWRRIAAARRDVREREISLLHWQETGRFAHRPVDRFIDEA